MEPIAQHSTAQHSTAQHSTAERYMAQQKAAHHGQAINLTSKQQKQDAQLCWRDLFGLLSQLLL